LCIDGAEFFGNALAQVIDTKRISTAPKSFVTFISVDFYNHDTETTQISEGLEPNYSTQFSFRNRVDDFYIQCLQKQTIKLEIMVSQAQKAE
jgi:hypothetical protein